MKVIKKEYEVLWLLMIDVDLFTCDTPLGITFDEFNRLSEMDDDLSTYKVRIPRLSYPPFDEPRCDNLDNYDHEVYKQSLCYDHEEKSYAEVVIFINTRLVRLIDVTVEQCYKQQFNDYVEIKRNNDVFEHDVNMECDPSNVEFAEWVTSKFSNHSMMDWYTKNALRMYWVRENDEEVLTDKELSNPEEIYVNEEDETTKIFRIETNIFDFETPLCKAFC
ncbi:hypothetical protein Tco_0405072 [Tanacetum coccineum]